VLAYRDELNGLLRGLDKEGRKARGTFTYKATTETRDIPSTASGRGRNLHIPAVCLSLLGGIQPGKLQAYIHDALSGGAADDGLLQRFGLLVWPDVGREWRNVDRFPDTAAKNAAFETFQRLDVMQPGTDPETGEPAPAVYRFAPMRKPSLTTGATTSRRRLDQANITRRWNRTCPNTGSWFRRWRWFARWRTVKAK
jgi:putative DNA primase/helicase